jgi:hypothetical protein
MNFEETGKVMALISAYNDRFEVSREKIIAWHQILEKYSYPDCMTAVTEYFTNETTPWIMPADIIQRVEEIQLKRLEQFGGFMPLNPQDEFDSNGNLAPDYKQKIQHLHRLARNGQITPAQYDAYRQDKLTLTQLTNQAKEITS